MKRHCFAILTAFLVAPALSQDCGEWSRVPTPNPGTTSNLLFDVAAVAPDLAIAVGNRVSGSSRLPVVVRWNGAHWSGVALPGTAGLGTDPYLEGVGRAPNGDLWVVGYVRTTYPTNQMPLIMRWRDGDWDTVVTPTLRPQNTYPFAARGGLAYDVTGVAEDDVWVVGTAVGYGDASATSIGMALHFDGSSWEDVPVPLVGNRSHELKCVSASASDNVWAVGTWRSVAAAYKAFIVRYDGNSWSHIPNPGEGAGGGSAEAVVALAPDDVWVSGSFNNGAAGLIHWNGQSWDVPQPQISGVFASFAAVAPNDIWASNATTATYYHYDGAAWSPVASPAIPGSTYVLRGWGMDALGPCGVWSVGGYSDGTTQFTLAERLGPTQCTVDLNGSGGADVPDIFAFLSLWFAGDPAADFDGNGALGVPDIFAFLAAWFAGC